MAKVIIYAMAATFSPDTGTGFSGMSYFPFNEPIHNKEKQPQELRNVAAIKEAMQEAADQLKAENPRRGFFVNAMLVRGERAPNGFKKLGTLDYNPAAHGFEPEPEAEAA